MPIAWTSRLSFLHVQSSLSGRRREVYEAIRDWSGQIGPTIEDLAAALPMKECSVCARINELRDELKAIEDGPLKRNKLTGKYAKSYRAVVYHEAVRPPAKPKQLDLL